MPYKFINPKEEYVVESTRNKNKNTLKTDMLFVKMLANELKSGFSPIVGICGRQRIGKSFFAVWLAYIMAKFMGKDFSPETNTFYDPLQTMKKLDDDDHDVIIIDEAGDVLDNQSWFEKTQKALNIIIQTQGYKTMLYIIVSPFVNLDVNRKFARNYDYNMLVMKKGYAYVWKLKKKYHVFKHGDSVVKRGLHPIKLLKGDIPSELWNRYDEHSRKEKENIRQTKIREAQEQMVNDPIVRLKKMLRMR